MLKTREWLVVLLVAVCGAVATMIYRAMRYAFHISYAIAAQSVSALLVWALVGLGVVFLLRLYFARRENR